MPNEEPEGLNGWLLVYLIGSIPLLMVWSVGLSGFFFDYPVGLMVAIFLVLAVPLMLIPLRSPKAPRWNVAQLWLVVVLMVLRAIGVFVLPVGSEGGPPVSSEELPAVLLALGAIVALCLGWAVVWTRYFRESVRVRNTFGGRGAVAT